jgi:hypothetical protein
VYAATFSNKLVVYGLLGVGPGNQAPVVNAGQDQTIALPNTATLSGTAVDDGNPNPPGTLTITRACERSLLTSTAVTVTNPTSLIANSTLVTKIYVPREIFPLASTLSQAIDFAAAAGVLFAAVSLAAWVLVLLAGRATAYI